MGRRPGVPVRQRRVSTELRELRKKACLTCADVAAALGTSITKISRMETGERGLYADDVAAMLGLYRVPTKRREELLALVRNGAEPNWWQLKPTDLPTEWRDLMALESDATAIVKLQKRTEDIHGLLASSYQPEALAVLAARIDSLTAQIETVERAVGQAQETAPSRTTARHHDLPPVFMGSSMGSTARASRYDVTARRTMHHQGARSLPAGASHVRVARCRPRASPPQNAGRW